MGAPLAMQRQRNERLVCFACRQKILVRSASPSDLPRLAARSVQWLHPNVAVAGKLIGVIAAAMDLEGDGPRIGQPPFAIPELDETDAIDPRRDRRRVADGAGAQLVPAVDMPEARPSLRRRRQGAAPCQGLNAARRIPKLAILNEDVAPCRLAGRTR